MNAVFSQFRRNLSLSLPARCVSLQNEVRRAGRSRSWVPYVPCPTVSHGSPCACGNERSGGYSFAPCFGAEIESSTLASLRPVAVHTVHRAPSSGSTRVLVAASGYADIPREIDAAPRSAVTTEISEYSLQET